MSKQQHTPGPWTAYNAEGNKGRILKTWKVKGQDNTLICTLKAGHRGEEIANARLISKAPEMLEMIKRIDAACQLSLHCGDNDRFQCIEMILQNTSKFREL